MNAINLNRAIDDLQQRHNISRSHGQTVEYYRGFRWGINIAVDLLLSALKDDDVITEEVLSGLKSKFSDEG